MGLLSKKIFGLTKPAIYFRGDCIDKNPHLGHEILLDISQRNIELSIKADLPYVP